MLKTLLAATALAVATLPAAAPAFADSRPSVHVTIGVGDRGDYRDHRRGPNISRREAVRIAAGRGCSRVSDVDYNDGVWVVRGSNRHGSRMRVQISARNGRVLDVDIARRDY